MKLSTSDIKKSYKGRQVVKGVTVEVNQGEIVGLLGPNGAGKTTSFYMIVGLVKPDTGTVYLDDKDITSTAMYKRAKMGIGYLPQEVSVFRRLSVEDNIMAVLQMTKLSKKERKDKLEELLSEFSLNHVRKNLGKQLSGGEKRRTEIARALATDPKFILLDEPFAGVDPIAVEDIQSIVYKLKQKNIGILITDHNVQETLSITDRTYLLFEGNILRSGTAEQLASDEIVRKVYLGKNFELKKKVFGEDQSSSEGTDANSKVTYMLNNIIRIAQGLKNGTIEDLDSITDASNDLLNYYSQQDNHPKMDETLMRLDSEIKQMNKKQTLSTALYVLFSLIPILGWLKLILVYRANKKSDQSIDNILSDVGRLKNYVENPEFLNL